MITIFLLSLSVERNLGRPAENKKPFSRWKNGCQSREQGPRREIPESKRQLFQRHHFTQGEGHINLTVFKWEILDSFSSPHSPVFTLHYWENMNIHTLSVQGCLPLQRALFWGQNSPDLCVPCGVYWAYPVVIILIPESSGINKHNLGNKRHCWWFQPGKREHKN